MAQEFVITPERLKIAKRILAEKSRELSQDQLYDVMDECRWGDQISFEGVGGKLKFVLTDLQIVMLAAGFAAVTEARFAREEADSVSVVQEDEIPF